VHDLPKKPLKCQDLENKGDSLQAIQNEGVIVSSEHFRALGDTSLRLVDSVSTQL
jgi:hypothetical protein